MVHRKPYEALRAAYQSGVLSPVEVAQSALAHAEQVNADLNAFALIDHERAVELAVASERRWRAGTPLSPLDGMPMTVKEAFGVQGWPTRRGSLVSSPEPVAQSAVFVDRLLGAGAVLLGKTRAPEFNWKGVTDSPGYGVTRNPLNPELTPGGSSGGCSAAVAAGVVRVSLGSDAGGSVRIPAAFTGTVALKPTFGRIPQVPLPSAFFNVTHTGPIAASVAELAEVMQVISGAHAGDWSSVGLRESPFDNVPHAQGLRIGVLSPERWADAVPLVRQGMAQTTELLVRGGFEIKSVDVDVQRASRVAAFFYILGCRAAIQNVAAADHGALDAGLLRFVQQHHNVSFEELSQMHQERDVLASALYRIFDEVDVLMLPTVPILPFEAGRDVPSGWQGDDWMSWNPYTPAFNLTHMPALSLPVWPTGSALPVGVQLVASKGRDESTLALAAWLEKASQS